MKNSVDNQELITEYRVFIDDGESLHCSCHNVLPTLDKLEINQDNAVTQITLNKDVVPSNWGNLELDFDNETMRTLIRQSANEGITFNQYINRLIKTRIAEFTLTLRKEKLNFAILNKIADLLEVELTEEVELLFPDAKSQHHLCQKYEFDIDSILKELIEETPSPELDEDKNKYAITPYILHHLWIFGFGRNHLYTTSGDRSDILFCRNLFDLSQIDKEAALLERFQLNRNLEWIDPMLDIVHACFYSPVEYFLDKVEINRSKFLKNLAVPEGVKELDKVLKTLDEFDGQFINDKAPILISESLSQSYETNSFSVMIKTYTILIPNESVAKSITLETISHDLAGLLNKDSLTEDPYERFMGEM